MSRRRAAWLLIALAAGIWCYLPALHAWFAQDDYAFLALVRLLHQPWLLFVHNHFPDYAYFRPMGVFLWWLTATVANDAAWPQYALNLFLHLACVVALYTLLQSLRRNALTNALWASLYAMHPIAIGTALWLSDRFDLLTTLFSLLALQAAFAYAERPRLASLVGVLGALLSALLSKELGVVGAAAAFVVIALAPRATLSTRQRATALACIATLTLGWLAYRHTMLALPFSGSTRFPAPTAFVLGFWNWLCAGAAYLFKDPRAPLWADILVALALLSWLAAAAATFRSERTFAIHLRVAAGLFVLIFLPGLVQAPVAVKHLAAPVGTDTFFFHLIVPSRFFHLSLAGLICALALIATPMHAAGSTSARRLLAAGFLCALIALTPLSHRIAQDYASGTRKDVEALGAAETALERTAIPEHACQIYFLGTSSLWGFAGYSDPIVKGLAAQPERIAHCLIATEHPPFAYYVRAGSVQPSDYRPLHPLEIAGQPFPTLEIGDTQTRYFTMGDDIATAMPESAIFLEYRDGAFIDVSAAVRSGERKIDFAATK